MSSSWNVILNSLGFWIGCNGFQIYAVDSGFQNLRSGILFFGDRVGGQEKGKNEKGRRTPDRSR